MKKIHHLWHLATTDKCWLTISNILTGARFLLAPLIVVCFYYQQWRHAFALFIVAAITDVLDGFLARFLNEQTHLGTLLDPLADKCLLLCLFGSLAFMSSPLFLIPQWFFLIVLGREALMISGSIVLLMLGKGSSVEPLIWGKLTTFFQTLFLLWIFVCYFAGWEPRRTYAFFLTILVIFSLLSLAKYCYRAMTDVRPLLR